MKGLMGFDIHLKKLMLKKHITPYQLSAKTGVSKSYIYALCNGTNTNPSIEVCRRIAFSLNIELIELIDVKIEEKEGVNND